MKTNAILRNIILLAIIVLNMGCDQVTKNYARTNLEYNRKVPVVSSYFIYKKVENKGAFLSLGDDLHPVLKQIILLGMPLAVMIGIVLALLWKSEWFTPLAMIGLAFIVGGGLGNLIDRLLYGSVTDFMHIDLGFAHTGIFNMADVSLMIGMGILLYSQFFKK